QIKSEEIARKEQDPNNALWHPAYAVKRRLERELDWVPRRTPLVIFRVLNKTLTRLRARG
ncbi:MAG: hypothetical protein KJ574_00935, partial [Nanoarchaeota archaeon]|nr:hypothetical protein [Nanoarchaeota archaeon]